MKIFGVSIWTIFILLAAMFVQSKYNVIAKIPGLNKL